MTAKATSTPAKRAFSPNEAADILGVTPLTIRRWIASGRLKAYRIGPRLVRIDAESVEALKQPIGGAKRESGAR